MNLDYLSIVDLDGERRLESSQLPLQIGTGADCDLRLPGPGVGPVALLDILDGAPFVQPAGRASGLSLNGEPLGKSHRLRDGDVLSFYGSRILVEANEELCLRVQLEDSSYVTQAPELPDAETVAAEQAIAPTAFRRAASSRAAQADKQSHVLRNGVIAGLLFLAVASYLLFSAKSVQFVVDPADPDHFAIDGGWFRLPLGDRVLLRQGEYTVRVEKAGYYDVAQTFIVDDAPTKTVNVSLRKLPGRLTVTTTPAAAATVTIDETHIGPAPFGPVELQPGQHSLQITAERFLPFADTLDFAGLGRNEVLNVQLVPGWASVTINSDPPGAGIFDGQEKLGTTPAVIELLEGSHQLSVLHPGYKAWDGVVVAEPNVAQELPRIQLEAADARLRVNTVPHGANVLVNGRYRGQSPLDLDLEPDIDYEIGLSKAGYGTASRKIRLQSSAREAMTVDLTARTGSVKVNVAPADARVYVNGQQRGSGTISLQLSSAPHRIEVRKSGYETWSRTVTPRPGYPQTLTASLRSHEAIERSKIAINVETVDGIQLRRIEPGTFLMGSSRSEQGRRANEVRVPVTITRPFYIGVYEVTNKEFAAFKSGHDSGSAEHATLAGDQNPVANVTWEQAAEFCNFLSAREGLTPVYEERFGEYEAITPLPDGYRLPTEAEWVWALRYAGAEKAPRYSWGDDWPPRAEAGNLAGQSASQLVATTIPGYDDGFAATAPVGQFPANPLGIFDVGGNVAEWVNDYYTVPTPGLKEPLRDPSGPERGSSHVIRGSSWKHAGRTELRLSYRDYGKDARTDVGFRIARTAE